MTLEELISMLDYWRDTIRRNADATNPKEMAGAIIDLMAQVEVDCPDCGGLGFMYQRIGIDTQDSVPCSTCHGTGKVKLEMKRIDRRKHFEKRFNDLLKNGQDTTREICDLCSEALIDAQLADCKEVLAQINAAHLKEVEALKAEKKEVLMRVEDFINPLVKQGSNWQQFKQENGG